jgi:predicted pyridoxine 5'-phosphate oxidase superfamily flavin-nucleotide-binding protein
MKDAFHEGERVVQERAGESAMAEKVAAGISGVVHPGVRGFLAAQRMVALASVDEAGAVWASLLLGQPGLLEASTDGASATIDLAKAARDPRDVLWSNLRAGESIGLVAIDLATRRRYRVNGRIEGISDTAIGISVREAYGNCPKYIQRRRLVETSEAESDQGASGTTLDAPRKALIERADTAFVASVHPSRGADVSHRGGERGFLRVLDEATIRVPDYPGNSLFNTLGNLAVSPSAGLAVVDFEGARLLQLTGLAQLRFDLPEDPAQPSVTGRYWDFRVSRWIERALPHGFRWELVEESPLNPR